MRTLSNTLLAAQKAAPPIDARAKLVLTYGSTTHTYTETKILDIKETGDGLILLAWEGLDMIVGELGQYLNLSGSEVEKRAQTALRYVSYELQQGEAPITYQEFKHLVELADEQ